MQMMNKYMCVTVLASALALTSGCVSWIAKAAGSKIVDTGIKNPEGTETFFRGARSLGCNPNQSSNGQWYVDCPPNTVGPTKISFGFEEEARNLTVGCGSDERAQCEDPINAILAAGGHTAATR